MNYRVTYGALKRLLCCSENGLEGVWVASYEARVLVQAEDDVTWARMKAGKEEKG